MSKSVLGKGLASLIQNPEVSQKVEVEANKDRHPGISFAVPEEISINPFQPRTQFNDVSINELSESIKELGLIQPLIVRKKDRGYELIAGERRLRAAKLAGLKQVPIVIRKSTDKESLEMALVENIQREDLNCVDIAISYQKLIEDFGYSAEQLAEKVGKDRTTVTNHLRLLNLNSEILGFLKDQKLSFGHGRGLLAIEDKLTQLKLAQWVIEGKFSVRELEDRIRNIKNELPRGPKKKDINENSELSRRLSQVWGTHVKLQGNSKKGKIIFHYSSAEDLDRILQKMNQG